MFFKLSLSHFSFSPQISSSKVNLQQFTQYLQKINNDCVLFVYTRGNLCEFVIFWRLLSCIPPILGGDVSKYRLTMIKAPFQFNENSRRRKSRFQYWKRKGDFRDEKSPLIPIDRRMPTILVKRGDLLQHNGVVDMIDIINEFRIKVSLRFCFLLNFTSFLNRLLKYLKFGGFM